MKQKEYKEYKDSDQYNSLTNDQKIALEMMIDNDLFILTGLPGSGKTYLINFFREFYQERRIVTTAPTWKALSVVNGDYTIQSYLNLKLSWKEDKQILIHNDKLNPVMYKIKEDDCVILDEVSMCQESIIEYLKEYQDEYNLKVICVGDPNQLYPVNEEISAIWKQDWPTYELKEIVRQKEGNPIIKLTHDIIKGYRINYNNYVDNKHVFIGGNDEMKKFFVDNYSDDDICTFLSHKNKIVDKVNIGARNLIKDNPKDNLLVGEKVYVRSSNEQQTHKLEDIVTITNIGKPYNYNMYNFMVRNIKVMSNKGSDTFIIPVDENEKKIYKQTLKMLIDQAKAKIGSWQKYYNLFESIGDLKHIYSQTVYRSQGSTFRNVIVNTRDVFDLRLKYTAMTRPSDKLFLLV